MACDFSLPATLIILGLGIMHSAQAADIVRQVKRLDFNRDVRPILSDKCFRCHGPDEKTREADLRLDRAEEAMAEQMSGLRAIVPGDLENSELIRRISTEEEWERMPPADSELSLSPDEIETLQTWILQGAEYAPHWSFVKPARPKLPRLDNSRWCKNPIDHFIVRRLRQEGIQPSPEADKRTLIRRVSFDLNGLPPTIEEVNAFLADDQPDAYERLVDRLLGSTRYGERMAMYWLDLARYADSDGYEKDGHREMWPYRDWVINAFNENQAFDEFTIEQLAGDLLPGANRSQRVASAFNRNGPTTSEGGANPDEYAAKYAVDRLSTTSTVWLGLTMQCAECHDHKYDPLSTKDFYRMFGLFNQVPEDPISKSVAPAPSILVPTPDQQVDLSLLKESIRDLKQRMDEKGKIHKRLDPRDGLMAEYNFRLRTVDDFHDTSGNERHTVTRAVILGGYPTPDRIYTPLQRGVKFRGLGEIDCGSSWNFDLSTGISFGVWIQPNTGGVVLSKIDPQQSQRGFALHLSQGKAEFQIMENNKQAALHVVTTTKFKPGEWLHVFVNWDGEDRDDSIQIFFDGQLQPVSVNRVGRVSEVSNSAPLRIGSVGDQLNAKLENGFRGSIDQVRIYDRTLEDREVLELVFQAVDQLEKVPFDERTVEQSQILADCYEFNSEKLTDRRSRVQLAELEYRYTRLVDDIACVRVMEDAMEKRPTFILIRGDFRSPGDQVSPGIPEVLGGSSKDEDYNRLDFAKWLVGDENPLTARVTVNRLWQLCFSRGIVATSNDFGSRGAWPTHPELLDWLATEFIASGWDIKVMMKLIVMSSTYRQSSQAMADLLKLDPDNQLLARGPRHRLPAEMLRDNALKVSGLLHEKIGGPSVFPYHPPGIWEELTWSKSPWKTWPQSHGDDLYRRGLYTFWKRSITHPMMTLFDAPSREVCVVDRPITNTPLQAFVTLNSPTFFEAARVFAQRIMHECSDEPSDRVRYAYLLAISRPPSTKETEILVDLYDQMLERYSREPDKAESFLAVGESPRPDEFSVSEHAAWTIVAQAILNLDEALTKE